MKNFSVISLIAANSVPFFGVLFLDWSLFSVVFFYWSETIVIGFYTVLKMIKSEKIDVGLGELSYKRSSYILTFFLFYGFCIVLYRFPIFWLFGPPDITIFSLIIGMTSLFISHGISYFENFIVKEEYKRISPRTISVQPIYRIFIMHITILLGGFAIFALKLPAISVLILVILKTIIDLYSHKWEHKKFSVAEGKYKMRIFKGGKIIEQSFGDLPPLDMPKSTKDSIVKEAFKKTPWLSLMTRNLLNVATKDPRTAKGELQQKMDSVMEEFQERIDTESEKEKINNEISSEKDNTQISINKEEDNIKNQ